MGWPAEGSGKVGAKPRGLEMGTVVVGVEGAERAKAVVGHLARTLAVAAPRRGPLHLSRALGPAPAGFSRIWASWRDQD